MTIVDLARDFALKHHGDQMYGNLPYEYHLNSVYEKVKKFNLGTDAETVAWLHDVYEDCDVSIVDIQETFGENISEAVKAISNKKTFSHTLVSINQNYLASQVKYCDRICNMQESVGKNIAKKYLRQHNEFTSSLKVRDYRMIDEMHEAYLALTR